MSYNILNGGRDGGVDDRWRSQVDVILEVAPDVLLLQEARGFDADGRRLLFEAEQRLSMRGLLARAERTGQHTAVFLGSGFTPLAFDSDTTHFHHALAQATIAVEGLDTPVTVASIHLSPLSPALRAAEVGWLAGLAAPGRYSIVAGDANSIAPGDPEPVGWLDLPAHFRVRYLDIANRNPRADRSALAFLHAAGFVDAATLLGYGHLIPTVPTKGFPHAEFVPFRSDHCLLSPALAPSLTSYRVVDDARTQRASDHLPIVVDVDLAPPAHAGTAA